MLDNSTDEKLFGDLKAKIEKLQKDNTVDLSADEDLSVAVMNLVSLEEHFFFSGAKTGKTDYYDLLNEVREMRKKLLGRLIDVHEAESWCISKHLLAATMRLMEVGTKYQKDGKKKDAEELFGQAFRLYSYFWALRLKLVDLAGVTALQDGQLNIHDPAGTSAGAGEKEKWSVDDIVKKLVNCCKE